MFFILNVLGQYSTVNNETFVIYDDHENSYNTFKMIGSKVKHFQFLLFTLKKISIVEQANSTANKALAEIDSDNQNRSAIVASFEQETDSNYEIHDAAASVKRLPEKATQTDVAKNVDGLSLVFFFLV